MRDLLAWGYVCALIAAAYPFACGIGARLALHAPVSRILVPTLMLASSTGLLSGVVLYLGIVGVPITWFSIIVPYLIVLFAATMLIGVKRAVHPRIRRMDRAYGLLIVLIAAVAAACVFNAVYFPLWRDDTTGIYLPAALPIFYHGALDPLIGADSLYRTYPVLIPSLYALGYFASGWENDSLAKLLPALLSIGCIPAAYLLGCELAPQHRRGMTGLIAALLLAITPSFVRWASSAYVDLPMAFFLTLTIFFGVRLFKTRAMLDAGMMGALFGCALFTKNAALFAAPLIAVWLGVMLTRRQLTLRHLVLFIIPCALIGVPFYVRNWIGAGFIVPNTAWVDQARPSLANLLVFVTLFDTFALTGLVITVTVVVSVVSVARAMRQRQPFHTWFMRLALLILCAAYFGVWWLTVSYDPRFLLLFLPILTVIAADRIVTLAPRFRSRFIHDAARIAVLIFGLLALYHSVEFKDDILRDPFMSYADKLALVGRDPIPPP
jgi:4-amino-4-deoxy-L-arabinose transferase-like glycosyltransferase